MTEHSERAWPRLEEGSDDQRFRPSDGSSNGSLSEVPRWGEQPAGDVCHEAGQEPRQAQGSPDASVVESNGVGSEIPSQASTVPVSEIRFDQLQAEDAAGEVVAARFEAGEIPTWAHQPAGDACHEAGQEPRKAQGSPDASVVESNGVGKRDSQPGVRLHVSETGPDQSPAPAAVTHVGWVPPRAHAHPGTQQQEGWRSVDDPKGGRRSSSRRMTFVCICVVVGLVVVVSRRGGRRCF
jgi:hypothetical protein